MNNKKIVKVLFVLMLFFITICMTSCFEAKLTTVVLNNENTTFNLNAFDVEELELKVTYSDDEVNYIKVKESMLSEEDLNKLKTPGVHTITINYKEFTVENVVITILEGTSVDEIKVIVDDVKYTAEATSDGYIVKCTHDQHYVYVIITVTLDSEHYFSSNGIDFYVNDELIDSSKYTINKNILEYKYKDQHWTSGIY